MKKLFTLLFLLSISWGFAQNILDTSAFAHKLDSIWYLESKLSLNYFEGNQSLFVGATDIVAGHSLGDSSAIWFIGGFNTVSSEGTSIRSSTYGHLRYNKTISKRTTLNTYFQFQSNNVLDLQARYLIGVNATLDAKDTRDFLSVGIFYEREEFTIDPLTTIFRGNVMGSLQLAYRQLKSALVLYYQPSLQSMRDFRVLANLNSKVPVSDRMSVGLDIATRFDNLPNTNLRSFDLNTLFTLSYKIK